MYTSREIFSTEDFDKVRRHMRHDVPEGRENETSPKYKAQKNSHIRQKQLTSK